MVMKSFFIFFMMVCTKDIYFLDFICAERWKRQWISVTKVFVSSTRSISHIYVQNALSHNGTKYFHSVKENYLCLGQRGFTWLEDMSSTSSLFWYLCSSTMWPESYTGRPHSVWMLILSLSGGGTSTNHVTSLGLCFLIFKWWQRDTSLCKPQNIREVLAIITTC